MEKDVNAVTKQDLEKHPALSSEQAKRIIDWRETRGSFKDVTELAAGARHSRNESDAGGNGPSWSAQTCVDHRTTIHGVTFVAQECDVTWRLINLCIRR